LALNRFLSDFGHEAGTAVLPRFLAHIGAPAVMKYCAFQFMQAVHLLELKLNACEAEKTLLQQANERLRQ
jgi:hypothetical protein